MKWMNKPTCATVQGDCIEMTAPKGTNLFNSPLGTFRCADFPFSYEEVEGDFAVKCKIASDFENLYDLGSLVCWECEEKWIKFAYENSDMGQPAIVSVVTDQYSDDCNGPVMTGDVWLQICRKDNAFALHYSQDGLKWSLARIFHLEMAKKVCIGVSAQCPMGEKCEVRFSNFEISKDVPQNIRSIG